MKILLIGFLAFISWSAISDYIYVCKIRGLCSEPKTIQMSDYNLNDDNIPDSIPRPVAKAQAVVPENLVIYFRFDRSEFNQEPLADKYIVESKTYLDQNSKARLSIIGYTDATGSVKYNQALGYRRAQSVKHYFETKGLPANMIVIESKGENFPADNNNTKAGRAKNRRTVITINK
jgi:outer membrane protein OmpA-like peptidoglycan-associated protein